MSNSDVSRINDYGWIPKKKSKPRKKLFGEDDFKFFIFMSIFIFCLAGLVLVIAGMPEFALYRLHSSYRSLSEAGAWEVPTLRRGELRGRLDIHHCTRWSSRRDEEIYQYWYDFRPLYSSRHLHWYLWGVQWYHQPHLLVFLLPLLCHRGPSRCWLQSSLVEVDKLCWLNISPVLPDSRQRR